VGIVEKAVDRSDKCGYNKTDHRQKPESGRAEGPESVRSALYTVRRCFTGPLTECDQSYQKADGFRRTGAFWFFMFGETRGGVTVIGEYRR